MNLKEKLFICATTINFLALWITIFLLGAGAIEGNPIIAYFYILKYQKVKYGKRQPYIHA